MERGRGDKLTAQVPPRAGVRYRSPLAALGSAGGGDAAVDGVAAVDSSLLSPTGGVDTALLDAAMGTHLPRIHAQTMALLASLEAPA
jgi:hypothetical protein